MAADTGTRKIERDTVHHLARIATALETISDTLAKMHEADPMAMIQQALEAEKPKCYDLTCHKCGAHIPGENYGGCEKCGHYQPEADANYVRVTPGDSPNTTVPYGADLPESERWRLGQ